jgi:HAE1 family hydrophobic/amphiphilic exporter-1
VVPTFYDSIEIARDRAFAKFHRRAERWPAAVAFAMTLAEAFLTVMLVRFSWRMVSKAVDRLRSRGRKAPPAPLAPQPTSSAAD